MVFRELSFSRLECGVHDRLHIYPLCGIFYFPWHRHQIEGTNGFYCLIRKTERFTISNVESQVFERTTLLWQSEDIVSVMAISWIGMYLKSLLVPNSIQSYSMFVNPENEQQLPQPHLYQLFLWSPTSNRS